MLSIFLDVGQRVSSLSAIIRALLRPRSGVVVVLWVVAMNQRHQIQPKNSRGQARGFGSRLVTRTKDSRWTCKLHLVLISLICISSKAAKENITY